MNRGTATANLTCTAVERLFKLMLDEVSTAYQQGDPGFLSFMGISTSDAQSIDKANRRRLAKLLASEEGILTLSVNQAALSTTLIEASYSTNQIRQCRELINAGATQTMLSDLGFLIAREGGSQRDAISGLCKTHPTGFPPGRPPNIESDMVLALDDYWASIRNPSRINPIDHLLRTAEHLDIRVASIWNYIQTYPSTRCSPAPPGIPDWIMVVFPEWPHQKRSVVRMRPA